MNGADTFAVPLSGAVAVLNGYGDLQAEIIVRERL